MINMMQCKNMYGALTELLTRKGLGTTWVAKQRVLFCEVGSAVLQMHWIRAILIIFGLCILKQLFLPLMYFQKYSSICSLIAQWAATGAWGRWIYTRWVDITWSNSPQYRRVQSDSEIHQRPQGVGLFYEHQNLILNTSTTDLN